MCQQGEMFHSEMGAVEQRYQGKAIIIGFAGGRVSGVSRMEKFLTKVYVIQNH
jgi:hypothetical protein